MDLVDRLLRGDVRALARAVRLVEDGADGSVDLLRRSFPHTGRATVVGFTGSPGAGKSTLVDRVVSAHRRAGRRVAVVAIDPSSAFSGGAILGDRVRMMDHAADDGVFIRSMATRGHLGGLARSTSDAVDLLDAAGYDPILIETVGVGQDEIEIVRVADAVCVVLVPGMGDDIQAIKAGILEIADLFVVNKADRPGVDRLTADLEYMLGLVESSKRRPQILRTVAVRDEGVGEVVDALQAFLASRSPADHAARRRERAESRFRVVLAEGLLRGVLDKALPAPALAEVVRAIAERGIDPYTAAERVLARVEVR